MSERDPLVTLGQLEDFARQAAALASEGSREQLETEWRYLLASERAVELIGGAATRLPSEVRERHSQISWPAIIGIPNRLLHGHETVEYDLVWDVLANHAPHLLAELPAIIAAESLASL